VESLSGARFVRFVSTPEVLEFVSSVEDELTQIEEAISMRAMESASPSPWGIGASLSTTSPSFSAASKILLSSSFEKTGATPKVLLLWIPPYLKNIHVLLYQGCTSLERTQNNMKRKRLN
jgi:hypothetical protein